MTGTRSRIALTIPSRFHVFPFYQKPRMSYNKA